MEEKKNFDNTMTSSKFSLFNSATQYNIPEEHALKCVANNMAAQMCLNEKCKHNNVFQCLNQNCQCRQIHERCQEGKSICVIKMVNSKISNTESLVQTINQLIDKKIDELSQLRQTLIKTIQNQFKYIDLNQLEKKFLQLLRGQGKIEEFTSSESKMIWQSSNSNVQILKNGIKSKINPYIEDFDKNITKNIEELRKNMYSLIGIIPNQKIIDPLELEIMKKSAICNTEQLAQRFIKIFGRKISKMSYLFCASQNGFKIKNYLENFGTVENTVVICQTNKEKIIGGYTPLAHICQKSEGYVGDPSGESFLFSLTDQQKFILKKMSGAIFRRTNSKQRISFGANQFDISDISNSSGNGRTYVNRQYYDCPAYSKNDKAAWEKFNGNQSCDFMIKEWEAWKVEF